MPQDKTQGLAESVARGLAKDIEDECCTWNEVLEKDMFDETHCAKLIAAALKRCRNEALEEAAKAECGQYRGTKVNSFLTGVESKNMAILALKEAE